MKRDELKALGLTDEQVDKVMALHGATLNDTKAQLATMTTKATNLEGQITTLTNDLTAAQKNGTDAERLRSDLTAAQASLAKMQKEQRMTAALGEYKPRNTATLMKLLDTEKVTFTDAGAVGLKEQVEALKKDQPFLFLDEKPPAGGGDPNPNPSKPTDYDAQIKAALDANNHQLAASLITRQAMDKAKTPQT